MAKDPLTGVEISIGYEHHKVHDSEMYSVSYGNTIASGATHNFYINPGTGEMHTVFNLATSGQVVAKLWEGITTSANGTSVTVYNMHRDSANSCAATFFHTPTWSTNTEVLLVQQLIPGGGVGANRFGSTGRNEVEWVLQDNTKYLVQIVNQAGATVTATLNIQFYEQDL